MGIFKKIKDGVKDTFSSPKNFVKNAADPGSILFGGASKYNSLGMKRSGGGKLIDWFGSPITADTQGQGVARAAAIAFGSYMAMGALTSAAGSSSGAAAAPTAEAGAAGATVSEGTITASSESLASQFLSAEAAGTASTAASEGMVVADAAGTTGTMSDVSAGLLESGATSGVEAGATPGIGDAGAFDQAGGVMDYASPKQGIVQSMMTSAKENPLITIGAMNLGGNVLKGVAGAQAQEKQQAHERDLLDRREQNLRELDEWKRRFASTGSYYQAQVPVQPSGSVLKRPDGTPVHGPMGIITGAMA